MSGVFSLADVSALERCEKIIEAGKQTFVEVAFALRQIQEFRLYRKDYDTFEAYCQIRWGWSRQRAAQIINSASVVQQLPENLSTRVDTEKAARELGKIQPEKREAVISDIAGRGERVTAPAIARAAKVIDIPTPAPEPKPELPLIPKDMMGYQIPKDARPFWDRRGEINELMTSISRVKCRIEELMLTKDRDPLYRLMDQDTVMHLQHAHYCLAILLPHAVCLKCQGILSVLPNRFCAACKGTGLMGKEQYKGYPYPEIKAMREKQITK